jgi:hypothetical protein
MGEVLRAILERNALYSQPSLWSIPIATTTTVAGAAPGFSRRQTSAQWKVDSWFLAVGWTQLASFERAAARGWSSIMQARTFLVSKGQNREPFELSGPAPAAVHNDNLNDFLTLPEYVLFAPGELVTLNEDVETTDPANELSIVTTVVLQGIEYQFPAGKGGPQFGYR